MKAQIQPYGKYYTFRDTPSSKPIKYCKVRVFNDLVRVNGYLLRVNHIFYAPKGHEYDMNYYIEPLRNPDYNFKADARALSNFRAK